MSSSPIITSFLTSGNVAGLGSAGTPFSLLPIALAARSNGSALSGRPRSFSCSAMLRR